MAPISQLRGLLASAEEALAGGRGAEAFALANQALAIDGSQPQALNILGKHALASRDPARALSFFDRALARTPDSPALWLNLAIAARDSGARDVELSALDSCLALDPYLVLALLQKGQWYERDGDLKRASRIYRDVLSCSPPVDRLPPPLRAALSQAEAVVRADNRALEALVDEALGLDLAGEGRLRSFVDVAVGKRRVYVQQPTGLHFPDLPAIQFYDNDLFGWLPRLNEATAIIRDELFALMAEDRGFVPYVAFADGQPVNQWEKLNHSLDWSVFFLWKDGQPVEANLARCPRTAALLSTLPLNDVPGRAPTALFSLLKPGAHIPPHTGVTNTRLTLHLPLVVPPGCEFRVGSDTRPWREGEAWVFDDTIEHEAWNRSDQVRAVMILDVWNPFLTDAEREGVRRITAGYDSHYSGR